jgi:hypothetical protein
MASRRRVSVHEAGHAVAAHALGLRPTFARVGYYSRNGLVTYDQSSRFTDPTPRGIFLFSGMVAEEITYGKRSLESIADEVDIDRLARHWGVADTRPWRRAAREILLPRQAMIAALAKALYDQERLYGDDIVEILDGF